MKNTNKRIVSEDLLEIGRRYVKGNESIRELGEEFGVSTSTVSNAKDVFLARTEGEERIKEQVKGKMTNLEEQMKSLSSHLKEAKIDSSSGKNSRSDKDKKTSINFSSWKPWAILLGLEVLCFLWLEWQSPSVEPPDLEVKGKNYSLPDMEDLDDSSG